MNTKSKDNGYRTCLWPSLRPPCILGVLSGKVPNLTIVLHSQGMLPIA